MLTFVGHHPSSPHFNHENTSNQHTVPATNHRYLPMPSRHPNGQAGEALDRHHHPAGHQTKAMNAIIETPPQPKEKTLKWFAVGFLDDRGKQMVLSAPSRTTLIRNLVYFGAKEPITIEPITIVAGHSPLKK
jgi:hypothetical protein